MNGDNQPKTKRNEKIKRLIDKGLSYGSVGKLLGISRARVHQIYSGYHSPENQSLRTQKLFREIKLRDELMCQWQERCKGKVVDPKDLLVHHINFNNQDDRPENLITLCKKCHLYFHRGNHINDKKIVRLVGKPERNKAIYAFYQKKKLNCREIGKKYKISGARVGQIIKKISEEESKK